MVVRIVKFELEAKLTGKTYGPLSKPSGKVERKSYIDGGERLKISIRNLNVPDQSIATVKVNGNEIVQIILTNGSGRVDNEPVSQSFIPRLEAGHIVEVYVDGAQLLSGVLHVD